MRIICCNMSRVPTASGYLLRPPLSTLRPAPPAVYARSGNHCFDAKRPNLCGLGKQLPPKTRVAKESHVRVKTENIEREYHIIRTGESSYYTGAAAAAGSDDDKLYIYTEEIAFVHCR